MACDAATLLDNAAAKGFQTLSERELKEAILYQLCNGPSSLTAKQVTAAATAAKYSSLTDRQLEECMLSVLCP